MKKLVTLCLVITSSFSYAQNVETPQIFTEYPFLADIYTDCKDLEFQIISSSVFIWIYVSDGSLYFQDGGLFCTETGDRDCRALYGLHDEPSITESCLEMSEVVPDIDTLSVAEVELIVSQSFVDETSGLLCANVTTSGLSDVLSFQFQLETEIQPVTFTSNILDENTIVVVDEDSLFVIKSLWIAGDLIPIQLENLAPIYTVCFDSQTAAGSYGFTLRDTDRLFSQFVVRDEFGDFVEIRDVSVSGNVVVEDSNSTSMEDDTVEGEGDDSGQESSVGSIDDAIVLFPWLGDLDVCGSTVVAYSNGTFTFVSIGTDINLELYFEDGTFYCSNSATFNCLEFYELMEPNGMWACIDE